MVFVMVAPEQAAPLVAFLAARGITIRGGPTFRLVTHLDVDADGVERVITAVGEFGRAWRS
jgi:threonine aldolase